MSLRSYLTTMLIATALCLGCFVFVVNLVDPETTNWLGFALFYFSLFLALAGIAAIFGFLARFIFLKRELAHTAVITAFRQSFLFALVLIIALMLLAKNLFTWINLGLLVAAVSFLEYFLISSSAHDSHNMEQNSDKS
jgi:hypothetical protein